jgi:hypothetical protein
VNALHYDDHECEAFVSTFCPTFFLLYHDDVCPRVLLILHVSCESECNFYVHDRDAKENDHDVKFHAYLHDHYECGLLSEELFIEH